MATTFYVDGRVQAAQLGEGDTLVLVVAPPAEDDRRGEWRSLIASLAGTVDREGAMKPLLIARIHCAPDGTEP